MALYPIRVGVGAVIVRDGSVLLVDFDDDGYIHTNLPGGGVDEGESLHAALHREVMEETAAEVEIGPMLFAVEYDSEQHPDDDDPVHALKLHFRCTLLDGSEPRFPDTPDPMETGVRWVPLDELDGAELNGASPALIRQALAAELPYDPYSDLVR